jgi:hypothetical protein
MHSPTKIRIHGRELVVTDHAERPDGVIHLKCGALALLDGNIELFEGDRLLTGGRVVTASLEIVIDPEHRI